MFYLILFVYLLGGLTFIPLLLVTFAAFLYYSSPTQKDTNRQTETNSHVTPSTNSTDSASTPLIRNSSNKEDQIKLENDSELPKLYRAGWLTVRQTYQPSQNSESTYMGLITNSYRNFMDQRSKDAKRTRPKDRFYTVLKQNVLFLYQDEDQVDCTAAIQVSLYHVDLHPSGSPDGELFVKRKAICLNPIIQSTNSTSPIPNNSKLPQPSEKSQQQTDQQSNHQPGRPAPWFLFTKNNLEKEDWYHILLASSKLTGPDSKATFQLDASLFDSQDMAKLVEGIDQQPDPIPMRWMNAMLGRLFLSTYRTHAFEHWIIDRIMKKLAKVQTPSFLSAINVREVNVGSTTPFFSKPMLKELTIDGDASMEVLVSYKGEFRITIETVATINLGARFKPYAVNLVLAVVLKELSGTLLLKIKRPPTNRLWFGFTAMPHLVLDLEPVVSTRQIKWALVLKPIESRIREVVMESIVYPNLDDLVFFDTQSYTHQGGIWGDAARKEKVTDDALDDQGSDESAGAEEVKSKARETPLTHKKSHSEPRYQAAPEDTKASFNTAREGSSFSHDTIRQRTVHKNVNECEDSSEAVVPTPPANEAIDNSPTLPLNQLENKRSSWFSSSRRQDTASTQASQASSSRNQNKNRPAYQQSSDLDEGDAVAKLQKFLRSHPEGSHSHPSTPNQDSKIASNPNGLPLPRVSEPVEIELTRSPSPAIQSTDFSEGALQTSTQPVQISSSQLVENLTSQENLSSSSMSQTLSAQYSEQDPPPLRRLPPPPRQTLPTTFLPPPTRSSSNLRSPNPPHTAANQSSSNSILNQLRTRAADKEAIAASVTQARDVVIKWGAAWASKRKSPQANNSYPYNSGFNPISIEQVQTMEDKHSIEAQSTKLSSLTEPVDMDISLITDQGDESDSPDDEPQDGERNKSKSYRAHRARVGEGKTRSMHLSSPQSRSASPVQDNSSSSSSVSHEVGTKGSSSTLVNLSAAVNSDESSPSGKRNRIFSSRGQFIPAAPQSTTSLSIPSPQSKPLTNHATESHQLIPPLDDLSTGTMTITSTAESSSLNPAASGTTPTSTAGGILSERSSYKPVPMMMIPGIKDSSHRFAVGSDSLHSLPVGPDMSSQPVPGPSIMRNGASLGLVESDARSGSPSASPGRLANRPPVDGDIPLPLESEPVHEANGKPAVELLDHGSSKEEDKADELALADPLPDPPPSSADVQNPRPVLGPEKAAHYPPLPPRPHPPADTTPLSDNNPLDKLAAAHHAPELNPDSHSPVDDAWGL